MFTLHSNPSSRVETNATTAAATKMTITENVSAISRVLFYVSKNPSYGKCDKATRCVERIKLAVGRVRPSHWDSVRLLLRYIERLCSIRDTQPRAGDYNYTLI